MNHNEPFRPPFQLKSRYLARELSAFVGATEITYESDEFLSQENTATNGLGVAVMNVELVSGRSHIALTAQRLQLRRAISIQPE